MTRAPFDWSSVTWTTYSGHPATGIRLQSTQIGPNTYWRVVVHNYASGTDTPLMGPEFHKRNATAAYRWHISAHERAERVAALRARITPGWTVDITDYDYLNDSREGARVDRVTDNGLTIRPHRPWASQGRRFPTMNFTWDGDMEVMDTTVILYRTPTSTTSRSVQGVQQIVKRFDFHPPRAY